MFIIRMADLLIGIDNRYSFVEKQCAGYIYENPGEPVAFTVSVTPEEIVREQENGDFSEGYCESICTYRHICEKIAAYNVFLMHSAVLEVDGVAYAFTAKSGVGKSTHIALWLKNIPNARIVNGDKPLYRIMEDGSVTVYGTPWNGKENWGRNTKARLGAVCFIERGAENIIRRAGEEETLDRLVHQLYLRGDRELVIKQLALTDGLLRAVPFYVLQCTISNEAAWLAYNTMRADSE